MSMSEFQPPATQFSSSHIPRQGRPFYPPCLSLVGRPAVAAPASLLSGTDNNRAETSSGPGLLEWSVSAVRRRDSGGLCLVRRAGPDAIAGPALPLPGPPPLPGWVESGGIMNGQVGRGGERRGSSQMAASTSCSASYPRRGFKWAGRTHGGPAGPPSLRLTQN